MVFFGFAPFFGFFWSFQALADLKKKRGLTALFRDRLTSAPESWPGPRLAGTSTPEGKWLSGFFDRGEEGAGAGSLGYGSKGKPLQTTGFGWFWSIFSFNQ